MAKVGRKPVAYVTSWGDTIPGLVKDTDGRWRIIETHQRFSERDEHTAIARYRQWERENTPNKSVFVSVARSIDPADVAAVADKIDPADSSDLLHIEHDDDTTEVGYAVDKSALYAWARKELLKDAVAFAREVGIPQLANLNSFDLPKAPVTIAEVKAAYRNHSNASDKAKQEALKPFERLVKFADAKTLDDLTDDVLARYRQSVVTDPNLTSSGTISGYFARIRSVISRAGRDNLDAAQIASATARCKAKLYAPENNVEDNPQPIGRADFHKLLGSVSKTDTPELWRAFLLMGLNAALYMEDLCDLRWDSLDLDKGTYVARRKKKGRALRVATLWTETIAAIKAVPQRGASEYVFVSSHGTRYNRNTKGNDFADLRRKAEVSEDVKWNNLRDGAYTAAIMAQGVDEKFARLLAGHKAHGLADKYVLRSPECVKPACDAVYAVYMA